MSIEDDCHLWLVEHVDRGGPLDPTQGAIDLPGDTQWARIRSEVYAAYTKESRGGLIEGRAALVTAGPPGIGKSTAMASRAVSLAGFRAIDPDVIKDRLLDAVIARGYLARRSDFVLPDGQTVSPRELSGFVHDESTRVADAIRRACLLRGENFVMHGTLAWDGIVDQLMDELTTAEHPYRALTIIDVEAPVNVALKQARQRWSQDRAKHRLGGRFVHPAVIAGMYRGDTTSCAEHASELFEAARLERLDVELEVRKRDGSVMEAVSTAVASGGSAPTVNLTTSRLSQASSPATAAGTCG